MAAIWITDKGSEKSKSIKLSERGDGYVAVETGQTVMISCYISPNIQFDDFTEKLEGIEEIINRKREKKVIIAGDLNAKSTGSTSMIDIIILDSKTYKTMQSSIILDRYTGSDHKYLVHNFKLNNDSGNSNNKRSNSNDKINNKGIINYRRFLEIYDNKINSNTNEEWTNNRVDRYIEIIESAANEARRSLPVMLQSKQKAHWWKPELQTLRSECHHARRKLQKARKKKRNDSIVENLRKEYKARKDNLKREIKIAKIESWKRLQNMVEDDPWGRPYKAVFATLKPRASPNKLNKEDMEMIIDGLFVTTPQATGDNSQNTKLERRGIDEILGIRVRDARVNKDQKVTAEEIKTIARSLSEKKAPGIDGLPSKIAKILAEQRPSTLLDMYNACYDNGYFPDRWKTGKLVLIPKKGEAKGTPADWRPLSMISNLAKVMERTMKDRILEEASFEDNQFGFRKGKSTTHALISAVQAWNEAKAKNLHCILVTLDVKNAFNTIRTTSIEKAINNRKFSPKLTNVLKNYLKNREIVYQIEDACFRKNVYAGVPQGSILGPILWNLVYDSLLKIKLPQGSKILGYADDVALIIHGRDTEEIVKTVNSATKTIEKWFENETMTLAKEKTEIILLTGRKISKQLDFQIGEVRIQNKKEVKYLGVTIEDNQMYKAHIDKVCNKAINTAGALVRLLTNTGEAQYHTRCLYYRVVESVIMYGAPVWHGALEIEWNKRKVHKAQKTILIRIVRAYRTTAHATLCVLAGQPPWNLLAAERYRSYARIENIKKDNRSSTSKDQIKKEEKKKTMELWQKEWSTSAHREWTRRLIPRIEDWVEWGPQILDYHLTQCLGGHGCFADYLNRMQKIDSPRCWFCEEPIDDANHTLFRCREWTTEREEMHKEIGVELTPENLIDRLKDEGNRKATKAYIKKIMEKKENQERHKQKKERERRKKGLMMV
ncbi:PREDICTED: retrovirus-related Pol polyprotein from type-1 retrotransposable element R1 [Dufourea novaeangliae]|uniref:retrovirus-related Pol polyprotein from type-1 retrotransposable element R1 n=1 Tax=Dufourea novaeangliae TaxID=178035 RepID=UPI0007673CB2|nr:PREDICTED: retrovirus-related Pol polyprotein from type-1 retrotransposable element R1 [Dufourea novaeangliae]